MIKRNFIKICLRQDESLNWENFNNRVCVLVLQGSIVVFGRHGKVPFRLSAGRANVFEGTPECMGTSVTNDTEVIIVQLSVMPLMVDIQGDTVLQSSEADC